MKFRFSNFTHFFFSRGLYLPRHVIINFFSLDFEEIFFFFFFVKFTTVRSLRSAFHKNLRYFANVYIDIHGIENCCLENCCCSASKNLITPPTLKPYFEGKECDAFLLHKTEYKCNSSSPWEIQDCDEARVEIGAANGVVVHFLFHLRLIREEKGEYLFTT